MKKDMREMQKKEAALLMQILDFNAATIFLFQQGGKVVMSKYGARQELGDFEKHTIRQLEESGYLVYHVVSGYVEGIGYCTNFLIVGGHPEDFEIMEIQAAQGRVMAYVYSHDFPDNSESGFISVERVSDDGCYVRTF